MTPLSILFLCTGNYYRSRFAEFYFRHLAARQGLDWHVDSRGLQLHPANQGPVSLHTMRECERLGVAAEPLRLPMEVQEIDLRRASVVVAVKETEHRPLLLAKFPAWEDRVLYWEVHDLDVAPAHEALPFLQQRLDGLFAELQSRA